MLTVEPPWWELSQWVCQAELELEARPFSGPRWSSAGPEYLPSPGSTPGQLVYHREFKLNDKVGVVQGSQWSLDPLPSQGGGT